jgi:UDP-N-acetylmuramoyl-L-alanyl-D-glutamate--2,6-diaminopimelate ligase
MVKKYRLQELKGANYSKGYLAIPDRKEAIRAAVNLLQPGDIVLISGKGHEDYQIIGSKRHHFSDKEEVLEALKLRTSQKETLH